MLIWCPNLQHHGSWQSTGLLWFLAQTSVDLWLNSYMHRYVHGCVHDHLHPFLHSRFHGALCLPSLSGIWLSASCAALRIFDRQTYGSSTSISKWLQHYAWFMSVQVK